MNPIIKEIHHNSHVSKADKIKKLILKYPQLSRISIVIVVYITY